MSARTYDPSTQTHTDCGEVTQPRTSTPDVGRILPDKGIDLPVLEQEPNQSIPQFGDGIKTDAPRLGIMEQAPQFDTGSNDEKSEETNMFESESEANTPIDNETTD